MANDTLVNSIYPVEYFTLAGVDPIQYPDGSWWSSRQRYAAVAADGATYRSLVDGGTGTSEFLEIDLGRLRQINYLNFDVLRVPLDIVIEYDAVSSSLRNPLPLWLPVQPIAGQPFDDELFFDGTNRSMWTNCDFHFTDVLGNIVQAEHLRISFARRDEQWPLSTSVPFQWPVFVKHLRVARYVSKLPEAIGPLLSEESEPTAPLTLPTLSGNKSYDVRQQFVYPADAARGDVVPRITGYSFLVSVNERPSDVTFVWSLWDITNSKQLLTGTQVGAPSTGICWFDIYFDQTQYVAGALGTIYEFRASSQDIIACSTVYLDTPEDFTNSSIPGTLTFTHGSTNVVTSTDTRSVVQVGSYVVNSSDVPEVYTVNMVTSGAIALNIPYADPSVSGASGYVLYPVTTWTGSYTPDATHHLISRLWADIGDSGKDVLGNAYRYTARLEKAAYAIDSSKAGWMSQPVPTPEAVESLYFDVRTFADSTFSLTQLDSIEIASRTPGVLMNIYYTQQGLQGSEPITIEDWDLLLWTPVSHQSYTLRRQEVINFPYPVAAAFIKLEFTGLNPLPFNLPTFPSLPPATYKVFPDWVRNQFPGAPVVVPVQSNVSVETQVLASLADPTLEFEHNDRDLLSQLALETATSTTTVNDAINVDTSAAIDSTTGRQVFLSDPNQFTQGFFPSVTQDTILGKITTGRINPNLITFPLERPVTTAFGQTIPYVSASDGRLDGAYQSMARTPMRFNKVCRHEYTVNTAYFNKKAYFVGIRSVRFLRSDFTISRDDPLIVESFWDDLALADNTWGDDSTTTISDGQTVYVTYIADGITYTDEPVTLTGFGMIQLVGIGGPATNLQVFAMQAQQGIRFFQNTDYDLAYSSLNGIRTTKIGRSALSARLISPQQVISYQDAGKVIGVGVIPQPPTIDVGTVVGVGKPSTTNEGIDVPVYSSSVYGSAGGTYGDLRGRYADTGTVIGVGHPSDSSSVQSTDTGTVIGVGKPSGTDVYIP